MCRYYDNQFAGASHEHHTTVMDRLTLAFWSLVLCLLGASTFFGVSTWRVQASATQREAKLDSGDTVTLGTVIDGDTLIVKKDGQGEVKVRILGIKAFESKHGKDSAALYGRAAEEALSRIIGDKPVRVLVNNPPRDRYGRTIATLYVGDQDVGLALVSQGHALVYSVYPFASMPLYLQQQQAARTANLGLWADSEVSARAEGMIRDWAKGTP
jgi:micrococcal nuclease